MLKILLNKLNQILDLMLEEKIARQLERQEKEQIKKDKELFLYLLEKRKDMPPIPAQTSVELGETPIKTKAKILVPYGLNDLGKAILEEFYNK
jgi:hypothetical protein